MGKGRDVIGYGFWYNVRVIRLKENHFRLKVYISFIIKSRSDNEIAPEIRRTSKKRDLQIFMRISTKCCHGTMIALSCIV